MSEVIFVRHGQAVGQDSGKVLGSTDVGLNELGFEQAGLLAPSLRKLQYDRVIHSPMRRVVETMNTALPDAVDPMVDRRLREIHFGDWEGLTFDEIRAIDAVCAEQWLDNDSNFQFPNGEKIADFFSRIEDFAADLRKLEGTTMIFAHGGVICHMISHFINLNYQNAFALSVSHTSVSKVRLYDGGAVLLELNNTVHLQD
jgi:broad specificity phosphatase PhoE